MRSALFAALACVAGSAPAQISGGKASVDHVDTPGFSLPVFDPSYPSETFAYEGAEARRLAHEILPIGASQVTRAIVHTSVSLPDGGYRGLFIDLAYQARMPRSAVCEEPHVFIDLPHDGISVVERKMRLSFNGGEVEGHTLKDIRTVGRYRRLSENPASGGALLEECLKLATDTEGWKQAPNINEFGDEEGRQRALEDAIRTLPPRSISCTGIDAMPCKFGRDQILALIRDTPPTYSKQIFVPEVGWLYVYHYNEPNVSVGTDYTVTMRKDLEDKRATIRIRFKHEARPVI